MTFRPINMLTVCFLLLVSPFLLTHSEAAIVVFGDSLSDAGNTFIASSAFTPAPLPSPIPSSANGYVNGAFTNGPNWIDSFASQVGESTPLASLAGGTNFAYGGSAFSTAAFLRPSLDQQVDSYLAGVPNPTALDQNDWHIIWGGSNDLLSMPTDSVAQQVAATISSNVDDLYQLGARRFLIMNAPDLGVVPLTAAAGYNASELTRISQVFNTALSDEIVTLSAFTDIKITEFDTFSFFTEVINNPLSFGLSNVTDAATTFDATGGGLSPISLALAPPGVGINPDEYLFYDGLHPTAVAHEILGIQVAHSITAVPEPSTAIVGLIALGWLGYRKRTVIHRIVG